VGNAHERTCSASRAPSYKSGTYSGTDPMVRPMLPGPAVRGGPTTKFFRWGRKRDQFKCNPSNGRAGNTTHARLGSLGNMTPWTESTGSQGQQRAKGAEIRAQTAAEGTHIHGRLTCRAASAPQGGRTYLDFPGEDGRKGPASALWLSRNFSSA
jgi:hypothetical protein